LLALSTTDDILTIFQAFVEEILYCREQLNAFALSLVSQKHRNLILLCASQIQKCIPMMFKMYESEGWTDTVTSKVKALNIMLHCFTVRFMKGDSTEDVDQLRIEGK
jgi:hypothetical protein